MFEQVQITTLNLVLHFKYMSQAMLSQFQHKLIIQVKVQSIQFQQGFHHLLNQLISALFGIIIINLSSSSTSYEF